MERERARRGRKRENRVDVYVEERKWEVFLPSRRRRQGLLRLRRFRNHHHLRVSSPPSMEGATELLAVAVKERTKGRRFRRHCNPVLLMVIRRRFTVAVDEGGSAKSCGCHHDPKRERERDVEGEKGPNLQKEKGASPELQPCQVVAAVLLATGNGTVVVGLLGCCCSQVPAAAVVAGGNLNCCPVFLEFRFQPP